MRGILGDDFDVSRHRCGVDVAFGLRVQQPVELAPQVKQWLERSQRNPVVGINVSGLVQGLSGVERQRYGIRAEYAEAIAGFISWLLQQTECKVVLVPHVVTPPGLGESDPEACEQVRGWLTAEEQTRTCVLGGELEASELKWVISRLDWMCGTRMHSTIAALSTGVPVVPLAYSDKFHGIFAQCGVEDQIVDLRRSDTRDVVERLKQAWNARDDVKRRLKSSIPLLRTRLERQMDEIVGSVVEPATAMESWQVAS